MTKATDLKGINKISDEVETAAIMPGSRHRMHWTKARSTARIKGNS